jgi:hypothetical protein
MLRLNSEDSINKAVAEFGIDADPLVRRVIVEAFTGDSAVCIRCRAILQLRNGQRFKARYNTPDHLLDCPNCGFLKLVHEAKPKPSTAFAWNIPDTVRVLQHRSVLECWQEAESIPESCLDDHKTYECEYIHDWYYKRPVLAVPQVLTYAWDAEARVLVTCDDSKPQTIDELYGTNKDAPDFPFRLKPDWYSVRRNSQVMSSLMRALDDELVDHAARDGIHAIVEAMLHFASPKTKAAVSHVERADVQVS